MLEQSMEELKKAKLDLPPPPQQIELPKNPFGQFQEPNADAKVINPVTNENFFHRATDPSNGILR